MIEVTYAYKTKLGEKWKVATISFLSPKKASRFIYACLSSKNKVFMHYSCDESDENEEMEILLR